MTIACFLGYAIHIILVYGGLLKIYKINIGTFFFTNTQRGRRELFAWAMSRPL